MKRIGLTGGIGSGKSTVARLFSILGIPVYNSDERAKVILGTHTVTQKVLTVFPDAATAEDSVDRKKLASIVFNDREKLEALNAIIHPEVRNDFEQWCHLQRAPYVIKEAAILIESGTFRELDQIIVVTAPQEMRVQRVMQRDSASSADVEARMKRQLAEMELIKHASFVIRNDEHELVIPQVLQIHNQLLK